MNALDRKRFGELANAVESNGGKFGHKLELHEGDSNAPFALFH